MPLHSVTDPSHRPDEVLGAAAATVDSDIRIEQQVSTGFVIFACLTEALLMIFICTTNGTILVSFVRKERLRTISNYYIIQMAVADFSVGMWMPMHIVMFIYPEVLSNMKVCTFRYASLLFSLGGSCTSLLAMTYDRLSAILQPLHYRSSMTTARYVVSAVVVWTWPIALAVVNMLWHNEWHELTITDCELIQVLKIASMRFFLMPTFAAISLAMIVMYIIIFRVAHRQALTEPPQVATNGVKPPPSRLQKEMKMIKTGLIVFAAFYCCWMPMILLIMIQISHEPVLITRIITTLRSAAVFPALLNSALNPIVYAFRMPMYRSLFYKLLPCIKMKVNPAEMTNPSVLP